MNSRTLQTPKWRLADLAKIVQAVPLREQFQDLMRSMRELPLAPYDLEEFLRLVGYDELCKEDVSEDMLPDFIAHLKRFLAKSAEDLLEILRSLQAREWPPVITSSLGPVLAAKDAHNEPSGFPAFRVLSFHDPPRRKL